MVCRMLTIDLVTFEMSLLEWVFWVRKQRQRGFSLRDTKKHEQTETDVQFVVTRPRGA